MTEAVDDAIDRCIKENILKELLVKCRGEVRNMVLSTFNKEQYERDLKTEGRVEGQNDFYPGYDIVTRGIFYTARLISSQLETEFTGSNYGDI